MQMGAERETTAAMLIIGNEILSGRTKDANLPFVAEKLNAAGIRLREVRVVPDIDAEIIDAVNALRARYDYVFTSGGIGPTHDDITAECIARAFGRKLIRHPEAFRRLELRYRQMDVEFNEMRQRMANTPEGAALIDNPVSTAPGFIVENVYVMAGVPKIMQAMLEGVLPSLAGGRPMLSRTVIAGLGEGLVAEGLAAIQERFADVEIGSYPSYSSAGFATSVVMRGTDAERLAVCKQAVWKMVESLGAEPLDGDARAA